MLWRVFVDYALSGRHKYNFVGNKHKLMELIGCLVSISIEQCRVSYQQVTEIDTSLDMLQNGITKDGRIVITTWNKNYILRK